MIGYALFEKHLLSEMTFLYLPSCNGPRSIVNIIRVSNTTYSNQDLRTCGTVDGRILGGMKK